MRVYSSKRRGRADEVFGSEKSSTWTAGSMGGRYKFTFPETIPARQELILAFIPGGGHARSKGSWGQKCFESQVLVASHTDCTKMG
jgi:hypothetical protein